MACVFAESSWAANNCAPLGAAGITCYQENATVCGNALTQNTPVLNDDFKEYCHGDPPTAVRVQAEPWLGYGSSQVLLQFLSH